MAIFPDGKRVSFGDSRHQDYTQHKNPDRKKNYLARHSGDPKSIRTPGALARDILWSKPTLKEAVKFASEKHGVNLKLSHDLR